MRVSIKDVENPQNRCSDCYFYVSCRIDGDEPYDSVQDCIDDIGIGKHYGDVVEYSDELNKEYFIKLLDGYFWGKHSLDTLDVRDVRFWAEKGIPLIQIALSNIPVGLWNEWIYQWLNETFKEGKE